MSASRRKLHPAALALLLILCAAIAAWYYWPPAAESTVAVAAGPRANVIRFSPDRAAKYLAAAFSDGRVRLWETATRRELPVKLPSKWPLNDLAWMGDATTLLVGGFEQHVLIWSLDDGAARKMPMFEAPVVAMAVRPQKPEMLLSLSNGELWWIDLQAGDRVSVPTGHTGVVKVIRFHPDGDSFVTGGADQQLVWHNADTRQVVRKVAAHQHEISSLSFTPDGRRLVSGSWDHTAKIWQQDSSEASITLTHPDGVACAAWHGEAIVTSCWDRRLRLWNLATSQTERERECLSDTLVFAVWPGHAEVAEVDAQGVLHLTAP